MNTQPTQERYLTTKQAAEIIGMQPSTLTTWRCRPPANLTPPPIRKMGASVRYPESKLLAWAEAHK